MLKSCNCHLQLLTIPGRDPAAYKRCRQMLPLHSHALQSISWRPNLYKRGKLKHHSTKAVRIYKMHAVVPLASTACSCEPDYKFLLPALRYFLEVVLVSSKGSLRTRPSIRIQFWALCLAIYNQLLASACWLGLRAHAKPHCRVFHFSLACGANPIPVACEEGFEA